MGSFETRGRLGPPKALFPRVDMEKAGLGASGKEPGLREKEQEPSSHPEISLEEFRKMDLRVARVVSAEKVKGSEKLLKLVVEMAGETRVVLAGIASSYKPEEMEGKLIVVVANLKPARIFGHVSQGMLLAAVGEAGPRVLTVDGEVSSGTRVS